MPQRLQLLSRTVHSASALNPGRRCRRHVCSVFGCCPRLQSSRPHLVKMPTRPRLHQARLPQARLHQARPHQARLFQARPHQARPHQVRLPFVRTFKQKQ